MMFPLLEAILFSFPPSYVRYPPADAERIPRELSKSGFSGVCVSVLW